MSRTATERLHEAPQRKLQRMLLGQKVEEIRWLTKEEAEESGWYYQPIQITFTNGVMLAPMSDDEGNEAGAMATNITGIETIYVNRD